MLRLLLQPIVLLFVILNAFDVWGQDESAPDYLRYPTLPVFTLLNADSVSLTNATLSKNKKVLIILFSPDCAFCRRQMEEIIANMEKLKQIEVLMATYDSLDKVKAFCKEFKLDKYPNIKVGRDIRYFFYPFYQVTMIPFLALYNENGRLMTTFNKDVSANILLHNFKGK